MTGQTPEGKTKPKRRASGGVDGGEVEMEPSQGGGADGAGGRRKKPSKEQLKEERVSEGLPRLSDRVRVRVCVCVCVGGCRVLGVWCGLLLARNVTPTIALPLPPPPNNNNRRSCCRRRSCRTRSARSSGSR